MEENNNTVEPIQQEEPKKRKLRRGTIPKLILALIMFVAGVTLIVISIKYDGNEVQKPEENNTTDIDIGPVVEPPENTTIYENVFIYTKEKTESGKQNYDILILRNDNTFVYNYDSAYSSTPIVGTYKEDGENIYFEELNLNEVEKIEGGAVATILVVGGAVITYVFKHRDEIAKGMVDGYNSIFN